MTTVNDSGRLIYKQTTEEDQWVVFYMPALTKLMDCHVNVDVCFTVNVFMYLYKYLFKGPDWTRFAIQSLRENETPTNEIDDYITGRYLSATEAAWRILAFNITSKQPGVTSIQVHLPGMNFAQMRRTNSQSSGASKVLRYFARPLLPQFESMKISEYFRDYRLEAYMEGDSLPNGQFLEQPNPLFSR